MLSLEYRLAPEHPHPIPVEDAYAGLTWLAAQTGAGRRQRRRHLQRGELGPIPEPANRAETVEDVRSRYLGVALAAQRPAIFNTRIASPIARNLINHLTIDISPDNGASWISLGLDSTLVTPFGQNKPLLVSFRSSGPIIGIARAEITRVRIRIDSGVTVPGSIELLVSSGSMRYRTDHATEALFDDYRIQNDVAAGDTAEIATPLTKFEKSNPRENDRKNARKLLDTRRPGWLAW